MYIITRVFHLKFVIRNDLPHDRTPQILNIGDLYEVQLYVKFMGLGYNRILNNAQSIYLILHTTNIMISSKVG